MKHAGSFLSLEAHSWSADSLAEFVTANPNLLPELFDGATRDSLGFSGTCALALFKITRMAPQLLYPYFHWFTDMFMSERVLLRRLACFALHNLERIDCQEKASDFAEIFHSPEMLASTEGSFVTSVAF
jgi:hypothetical protein